MIIVIQCAAGKRSDAGRWRTGSGTPIEFVARPQAAPAGASWVYARPDDLSGDGRSWRQLLIAYNQSSEGNPLGLFPANQLYKNRAYGRLVDCFGLSNVYILSAGWGLIRSDFLTPHYDITFSATADRYKRRRKTDQYHDFCMMPEDTTDDVVFLGGKHYLPFFCTLTASIRSRKIVFYNSAESPLVKGCSLRRYESTTRTNWHYECANAVMNGSVRI
jgi:hypothetical protein